MIDGYCQPFATAIFWSQKCHVGSIPFHKLNLEQYKNGSSIIKTESTVLGFFVKGMQTIMKEPNRKPKITNQKKHEGT